MFDSAACTVYIKKQIICQPLAMKYNGTLYYYVLNAQGDVVRIVNSSRSVVASYTYDPWGKIISSSGTLADINPLRYRVITTMPRPASTISNRAITTLRSAAS